MRTLTVLIRSRRIPVLLGLLVAVAAPRSTSAQMWNLVDIAGVDVDPIGVITPDDSVALNVHLVSGSAPIALFEPTEVVIDNNDIFVDIYAGSGLLAMLDSMVETVPLGTFEPGTYYYEVTQQGPTHDPTPVAGSFSVVPEPAALSLLALGGLAALRRRRTRTRSEDERSTPC